MRYLLVLAKGLPILLWPLRLHSHSRLHPPGPGKEEGSGPASRQCAPEGGSVSDPSSPSWEVSPSSI